MCRHIGLRGHVINNGGLLVFLKFRAFSRFVSANTTIDLRQGLLSSTVRITTHEIVSSWRNLRFKKIGGRPVSQNCHVIDDVAAAILTHGPTIFYF